MAGLGLLEPFHNIVNRAGHNTDAIISSYDVQDLVRGWLLPPGFFTSMAKIGLQESSRCPSRLDLSFGWTL